MTCNNLDISRVWPDFAASGCLYNVSFDRFLIRKRCIGGSRGRKHGYGARRQFCFRKDIGNTEACIKGTFHSLGGKDVCIYMQSLTLCEDCYAHFAQKCGTIIFAVLAESLLCMYYSLDFFFSVYFLCPSHFFTFFFHSRHVF